MGFLTSILALCVARLVATDDIIDVCTQGKTTATEKRSATAGECFSSLNFFCGFVIRPHCVGADAVGRRAVCILLLLQSVCMHGVHMHMRHRAPPKEGGRRCSGVVGRIKKGLLLSTTPRATCYIVN